MNMTYITENEDLIPGKKYIVLELSKGSIWHKWGFDWEILLIRMTAERCASGRIMLRSPVGRVYVFSTGTFKAIEITD